MNANITIGKIISPFGIKGLVKIQSFTDPIINLTLYKCFIKKNNLIRLQLFHRKKDLLICKIDIIKTRNDAEQFKNQYIYTLRSELNELKNDEFYIIDLINLPIIDIFGKKIGIVKNVINTSIPSLEIEFSTGKIILYPFSKKDFPQITSRYVLMNIL